MYLFNRLHADFLDDFCPKRRLDVLLSEHAFQEREDVAVCLLHGGFVVVDRHATLETRIGRTERLFRLNIKDNATVAFGETAFARSETLATLTTCATSGRVEVVMGIRILDVADVLACLRETRCILTAWSREPQSSAAPCSISTGLVTASSPWKVILQPVYTDTWAAKRPSELKSLLNRSRLE